MSAENLNPQVEEKIKKIASHYKEIIKLLGENPEREGLVKTPYRAAKAMWDMTSGYRLNPSVIAKEAIFEHSGSKIVLVKDIEFYSLCEHHILPFFGTISIGYIPDGKIIGLSKIPRIVNCFAKRLQVQENLTSEICNLISAELPNKGVLVLSKAQHLCMMMRGVEKQNAKTLSYSCSGEFENNSELREEFFKLTDN